MPSASPSLQALLSKTRLKIGKLPLQAIADRTLFFGVGLTLLTVALAAPAFLFPSWKAAIARTVLWIYAISQLFMLAAIATMPLGLLISFAQGSNRRAAQFD